MTVFIRALTAADKAPVLRGAARGGNARFVVDPAILASVPGSTFAYWVSDRLRSLFLELPQFECDTRTVRQGVATSDNFRFCRSWWGLPLGSGNTEWPAFVLGGGVSPFYYRLDVRLNWRNDGREVKAYAETREGTTHWSRHIFNVGFYGRSGFTWGLRTAKFQPSCVPIGTIFSVSRYEAFVGQSEDDHESLLAHIALLNASVVTALIRMTCEGFERPKFVVGGVQTLPVPDLEPEDEAVLAQQAREGWSHLRSLDTVNEVSRAFVVPALLRVSGKTFKERVSAWCSQAADIAAELARVQSDIDELGFGLYKVSDDDRRAIIDGFNITGESDAATDDDDDADEESPVELDPEVLGAGLVSWAVGVAVGRFDVRLATGEREWPEPPDPFDLLPVCSIAMLTGEGGLPLEPPPGGYPVDVSVVLVDDPGHEWDIATRVRAVFEVVFRDDADRWWTDLGAVLDSRGSSVENWLRRGFFDYHLNAYSKSRRKAPLLWPLATKSGSYRVWLYAHRVTADSLFRVLTDVIEPKLAVEQRRVGDLVQEFGPSPSASQRRTIDAQQNFVGELQELRDEIVAVAPLWVPDLNDGVVIVLAPFWRLFAHHRPWSNELKSRWKKLAAGDYDWAQLAMRIWPERVVPKCAQDRSLAIAHGFENVLWTKDDDSSDRWHPRPEPLTSIHQLITERTNLTVQAARNHPQP